MRRLGPFAVVVGLTLSACAFGPPPPLPYLYRGLESNFTSQGNGLSVVALLSPTLRAGPKLTFQGSPYQLSLQVLVLESAVRDLAGCQVEATNLVLSTTDQVIAYSADRLTGSLSAPEPGSPYATAWLVGDGSPPNLDLAFQAYDLDLDLSAPATCLGPGPARHLRVRFSPVERSGQALPGEPGQARLIVGQPVLIP